MQTLIVWYKLGGSTTGSYPANRSKRLSKKAIKQTLDNLINNSKWDIPFYEVHEDGMSRADDNRQYRAMCSAERRRGA